MAPVIPESSNPLAATPTELSPGEALSLLPPPSKRSLALGVGGGGAETTTVQVRYGFRTAGLAFLVQPKVGTEVMVPPPIAALPGAPAWLKGMINLRGTTIPVFDLAAYAGLSVPANARKMLLVFGREQDVAALVIDDAPQRLLHCDDDRVSPPALPERIQPFVTEASLVADELWLDFDHVRAFGLMAGCADV